MITQEDSKTIEIFYIDEIFQEHPKIAAKAIKLQKELGLEGQMSLSAVKEDQTERCPFRQIKTVESQVYRLLCPAVNQLEDFKSEAIPFRVLELVKEAKKFNQFKMFKIWSATEIPNPVLVAYTAESTWEGECFLLARWGEVLTDFTELTKEAVKLKRAQMKDSLTSLVELAKVDLKRIDTIPTKSILEASDVTNYYPIR